MKKYIVYLLTTLFKPFLLSTFVITTIIWITRSLKYLNYITEYGLKFYSFLNVILLILPSLLIMIIPISLLIANILTYNKLIKNNELIILQNSGIGKKNLLFPGAILSFICFLFILYITSFVIPNKEKEFNNIKTYMKNDILNILLNKQNFNKVNNLVFYVKEKENNILKSLIIYMYKVETNKVNIIYAKEGIVKDNIIKLTNGNIQEFEKNDNAKQKTIFFNEYSVDLSEYQGNSIKNDDAVSLSLLNILELFKKKYEILDEKQYKELLVEINQRIITSLLCLSVGIISSLIVLNSSFTRLSNNKTLIKAFVVSIIIFAGTFYSVKLAKKNIVGLYSGYAFTLIPMFYTIINIREKKYV